MRKKSMVLLSSLILLALALSACGGGGGGGGGGSATGGVSAVITGIASKGPLNGASVRVYDVNSDGSIGTLLGSDTTDSSGNYSVTIGSHQGLVVVRVSGGSYTDEATGLPATIPEEAPLRAAVVMAGAGTHQVAVTPLSELAARRAEASTGGFTTTTVAQANDTVSRQFGFNVVTTQPVAPTSSALAGASEAAANYTCALATLSQQASDASRNVAELLSGMAQDLIDNNGQFSRTTLDAFDQASAAFFSAANGNNRTGLTAPPANNSKVGRTPFTLRLSVTGTMTPVGGVMLTLTLPPGSSLQTDNAGQPATGIVNASSNAAGGIVMANYTPETSTARATLVLAVISAEDFLPGEFATVAADVPGLHLPASGDFAISNVTISDGLGVDIPGAAFALTVTAR